MKTGEQNYRARNHNKQKKCSFEKMDRLIDCTERKEEEKMKQTKGSANEDRENEGNERKIVNNRNVKERSHNHGANCS